MPARRALFFDGNRATAMRWIGGRVEVEARFRQDAAGLEEFAAYLAKNRRSLLYMLADVAEEGFQLENIPSVGGNDRTTLIKRRLGQYFYGTPLAVGISLGRATTGRRDERLLFAAMTRPEAFTPWLDAIAAAEVPLAGIYSVPLVLAERASQFLGRRDRFLLLTLSSAGLRQTYFDDGQMHFSRLAPMAAASIETVAEACKTEAAKTHQYLLGQRKITRGTTLTTVILAHPTHFAGLRERCADTPDIHFELLDLVRVGKQAGIKKSPEDSIVDTLLVHRLMTRTPGHQFAPSESRKLYRLWQLRFAFGAAALAMLASGAVLGGRLAYDGYELDQRANGMQAAALVDNQRYLAILDSLPKIPVSPDSLRAIIAGFDALKLRAQGPEPMLRQLGSVLATTPGIELDRLDWSLTPQLLKGPAGSAAPSPATSGGPWYQIELEAHLPRQLVSNQRAQVESVDAFVAQLQARGFEVVVTKQVIDVESGKTFRSEGASTSAETATAPKFSLVLGRKVVP